MAKDTIQYDNSINEVNIKLLINHISSSKKSIFISMLAFAFLTLIYIFQKEPNYESTALVEIGSYKINEEESLIENIDDLIASLKIELFYKQNINPETVEFESIEGRVVVINVKSPLSEFDENLLKNTLMYIQNRHVNFINSIDNDLLFEIEEIENKIKFINSDLLQRKLDLKFNSITRINRLKIEIPSVVNNIAFLKELIPQEQNNLLILESNSEALVERISSSPTLHQLVYSYKVDLINLGLRLESLKKSKLDEELKLASIIKDINDSNYSSEKIFNLEQDKRFLQNKMKLLEASTNQSTKLINKIETEKVDSNLALLTFLGAFFGFIIMTSVIFLKVFLFQEKD